MDSFTFIFGTRPWRIWHLVHILMLLPLLWFADYFHHFVPGAGPQGGEAVFALMLAYALAFLLLSVVNTLLVAIKAEGGLLQRLVFWPLGLLAAWLVALTLVLIGAEIGTSAGADRFDRWVGAITALAALPVYYGANLSALRRARRG